MTRGAALLADVGGTNARFAVCDKPGRLLYARALKVADFPNFEDALDNYLAGLGRDARQTIKCAYVAAAGPVQNEGVITLTNSDWCISQSAISRAVDGPAKLFNDVEAVGLELPYVGPADIRSIGPDIALAGYGNLLAVNVGTGFGASVAVRTGSRTWTAVATEAGHMSYAPQTPAELKLAQTVKTVECLLSGNGITTAYQKIRNETEGASLTSHPIAADVFGCVDSDEVANLVIDAFADALARVTSDLVLATGSWGGAFLCGSVAKAWAANMDQRRFREVFIGDGKMAARLRYVPTNLLLVSEPALLGLSRAVI